MFIVFPQDDVVRSAARVSYVYERLRYDSLTITPLSLLSETYSPLLVTTSSCSQY